MEIDHDYTDNIVCPWCGYSFEDNEYIYADQDSHDITCEECGKNYYVEASIEITYSTGKERCKLGCCEFELRSGKNPYHAENWLRRGNTVNVCSYECKICNQLKVKTGPVKENPYIIPLTDDDLK